MSPAGQSPAAEKLWALLTSSLLCTFYFLSLVPPFSCKSIFLPPHFAVLGNLENETDCLLHKGLAWPKLYFYSFLTQGPEESSSPPPPPPSLPPPLSPPSHFLSFLPSFPFFFVSRHRHLPKDTLPFQAATPLPCPASRAASALIQRLAYSRRSANGCGIRNGLRDDMCDFFKFINCRY